MPHPPNPLPTLIDLNRAYQAHHVVAGKIINLWLGYNQKNYFKRLLPLVAMKLLF